MKLEKAIPVSDARALIRQHVKPGATEVVEVLDAVGRVLAADVFSDIDVTPFDDSAMDGFAVIAADLEGATPDAPASLKCVAHIGAGSYYDSALQRGECARIMTGAPVPDGADSVVRIEDVTFEGEGLVGDSILFAAPVKLGKNIRRAGDEAKAGEKICEVGEVITPAGAGLLAACGNLQVTVYKRPVVGLISIGSELVPADQKPGRGMIRNSNIWAMQANVAAAGGIPVAYPQVTDDAAQIEATFRKAVEECDLVVSTGGACLGDYDLTGDIVASLGRFIYTRCDVKPGKSQPFAMIGDTPAFILSGNPAASSMGFELYVRLAMRIMQGFSQLDRPTVKARIMCDVRKGDNRMVLERAILSRNDQGELEVITLKKQSSGLYGAMQKCNCMVVIPSGDQGVVKGDMVTCLVTSVDESFPLKA